MLVNTVQHLGRSAEFRRDNLMWQLSHLYQAFLLQTTQLYFTDLLSTPSNLLKPSKRLQKLGFQRNPQQQLSPQCKDVQYSPFLFGGGNDTILYLDAYGVMNIRNKLQRVYSACLNLVTARCGSLYNLMHTLVVLVCPSVLHRTNVHSDEYRKQDFTVQEALLCTRPTAAQLESNRGSCTLRRRSQ